MSYQSVGTPLAQSQPSQTDAYRDNSSTQAALQQRCYLQVALALTLTCALVTMFVTPPWETGHNDLQPLAQDQQLQYRDGSHAQKAALVNDVLSTSIFPFMAATHSTFTSQASTSTPTIPATSSTSPELISTSQTSTASEAGRDATAGFQTASPSLYCIAIMQPFGHQPGLLQALFVQDLSLFGCDEYEVYSNESALPAHPRASFLLKAVPMKMELGQGGKMSAADFLEVMKALMDSGRYLQHDWTVKVDPEAVFLPSRLKVLLSHIFGLTAKEPGNVFLNNCNAGLQGSIEVMSTQAVGTFGLGQAQMCNGIYSAATATSKPAEADAEWGFGEDRFLQKCLLKLGVRQVTANELLKDAACADTPRPCTARAVAFHPLKNKAEYFSCVHNATEFGRWMHWNYPQAETANTHAPLE